MSAIYIDGVGPLPLLQPRDVSELGELVRASSSRGEAVYPIGGRTTLDLGMPPARAGAALEVSGLNRVIDFPARDMTVTVQAGITIRALADILAAEKLRLPIDVPQADRATLGGILATNTSGARRLGYGTLRDYVIGISAVNDQGNEFKSGGRVVKNVAGYDLCKLLVGSLGTLGVITQVTLKLRPLAEQQAVVCIACAAAHLEELLTNVHTSRTRPVCVEALNRNATDIVFGQAKLDVPEAPWSVLVGYEGNADAVSWQVQQLVKEVSRQHRVDARIDFTTRTLCEALTEFSALPCHAVALKANLLPSATAAFCLEAERASPSLSLRALAGSGIVCGQGPPDLTKEHTAAMLNGWRERAARGQGAAIITRCPPEWKAALDVWGPPRGDVALMRAVKAAFDAKGLFNPGRFVV